MSEHDKFCPLPLLGGLPDDTNCFVCEALRLKAADEREQAAQLLADAGYQHSAAFLRNLAAARGEENRHE